MSAVFPDRRLSKMRDLGHVEEAVYAPGCGAQSRQGAALPQHI